MAHRLALKRLKYVGLLLGLTTPALSFAADVDGATLSLGWGIPFVGILLSIALCPYLFQPSGTTTLGKSPHCGQSCFWFRSP